MPHVTTRHRHQKFVIIRLAHYGECKSNAANQNSSKKQLKLAALLACMKLSLRPWISITLAIPYKILRFHGYRLHSRERIICRRRQGKYVLCIQQERPCLAMHSFIHSMSSLHLKIRISRWSSGQSICLSRRRLGFDFQQR